MLGSSGRSRRAYRRARQRPLHGLVQSLGLDGLGDQVVHAGLQIFPDLMGHGVGGQRHDRGSRAAFGPFAGADHGRGGGPVHHRHLHVHQDQVPGLPLPGLNRLPSIGDHHRLDANLGQQGSQDQLVHAVVLGGEDANRAIGLGPGPWADL